jgi:NDP-sugar pyrophosphorylase family protein
MIAVIFVPWPSPSMHDLDTDQSLSLLALVDRPILQHIIESLVGQGIKSIEIIAGHAPEKIETLLGNGGRWGCSFRFHLASHRDQPYRALKVIERTKTEPWLLIHADRYPCVTFPVDPCSTLTLYFQGQEDFGTEALADQPMSKSLDRWGGTIAFPAGSFGYILSSHTDEELAAYVHQKAESGAAEIFTTTDWIDATTPEALLRMQANLLSRRLNGLGINGIERQPGVWISRNVDMHPTVKLVAPLYIGPNCRIGRAVTLGPNVVVSGGCIVDSTTTIEHSLLMADSYVGEGLELSQTIVDHNLLVNVRLGIKVDVSESFLLGGLRSENRPGVIASSVQSIVAAILILLMVPVYLLSAGYYAMAHKIFYVFIPMARIPLRSGSRVASYPLLCLGADAWKVHRPAGWTAFTRQFLSGLFAVLAGRISFVGLPPRSADDIERLPNEWRTLYVRGRAGLITEASLAVTHDETTQLYLADAYYSARRTWLHDLRLASRYFLRLFLPARRTE